MISVRRQRRDPHDKTAINLTNNSTPRRQNFPPRMGRTPPFFNRAARFARAARAAARQNASANSAACGARARRIKGGGKRG